MNTLSSKRLYGIVEFNESIECIREVLGAIVPIKIAGFDGYIEFPNLGEWSSNTTDPLNVSLAPPSASKTWKSGDQPIHWGRPKEYPSGNSDVDKVLIYFDVPTNELRKNSNLININIQNWINCFNDHFELITKQRRTQRIKTRRSSGSFELFCFDETNKVEKPYETTPTEITITVSNDTYRLSLEQLKTLCNLASEEKALSLEEQLQLEAYRALRVGDLRKAIIESAVAAEVSLTNAIEKHFLNEDIAYGSTVLKQFKGFGLRIELAKALGINLPNVNFEKLVSDPRNKAVHRGISINQAEANLAVCTVDDLLASLKIK